MKHTPEQVDILDLAPNIIRNGQSLIIEARAGSGKTYTLIELAPTLPKGGRCLAFNKAIALELERKLPSTCPASTFHSLGFALLRERLQTVRSDTGKCWKIAKDKLKIPFPKPYCEAVSVLKNAGCGLARRPPLTPKVIDQVIDIRGIEIPEDVKRETFVVDVAKLFRKTLADTSTIDFDDMLYLPLFLAQKYGWKFDQFPYLLIDEAQDVSPLRLHLIEALTSTVLAVGDPYQAIYGFAGAMGGALNEIQEQFNAQRLPLSVSFRCPTEITNYASDLIRPANIESLEGAPAGAVIRETMDARWYPTSPNEAVLCRMNAPLFILALKMLREGQPLNFRSDFPRQLISFMKRFKAKTCKELEVRLATWYESELERLAGKKGALALAKEKHDTLRYLASQHEEPKGIELTLETLLIPTDGAPTLSTIHKAKGLEWRDVYLLRPDLIPAPFATDPEELEQENNLHYVAVTRAVDTFTYLDRR